MKQVLAGGFPEAAERARTIRTGSQNQVSGGWARWRGSPRAESRKIWKEGGEEPPPFASRRPAEAVRAPGAARVTLSRSGPMPRRVGGRAERAAPREPRTNKGRAHACKAAKAARQHFSGVVGRVEIASRAQGSPFLAAGRPPGARGGAPPKPQYGSAFVANAKTGRVDRRAVRRRGRDKGPVGAGSS